MVAQVLFEAFKRKHIYVDAFFADPASTLCNFSIKIDIFHFLPQVIPAIITERIYRSQQVLLFLIYDCERVYALVKGVFLFW